ncbi:MAG: PQQ-binding-like beta-propeller repeat protein [Fuerstiella sp.]
MKIQSFKTLSLMLTILFVVGCSDAPTESTPVATSAPEAGSGVGGGAPMAAPESEIIEETPAAETPAAEDKPETIPAPTEEKPAAEEKPAPEPKPAPAKEPPAPVEAPSAATAGTTAGDWAMWGGSPSRNMVNATTGISLDFDAEEGTNVVWTAALGSQTYGNPIVAGGKVFVGTNNGGEYREKHKGDRGCILCFNEADGKFLWQLTREKLPQGRVNDWPEQGICSTPCIENGRMYVATNRCELMCIDVEGFHDGENDGPYKDETDTEEQDADIIWSLDMIDELGVFPHNLATSSPVIHGDLIMLVTSNGVDEAHLEVPSPRAPCFIAVNKNTGELVWEDNSPALDSKAPAPFNNILHGQWGSPALGEVDGKMQAFMPGGDGVLYSYDVATGELVWWFDLNPKESTWELGGRGTRNAIISTPVFVDNSVLLSVGQDPEHGEGVGHLYRIDATKKGDVSPQIADGDTYKDNSNTAQIWHVGGVDVDGSITGEENGLLYRRTISTVAVADGLVYAPDLSGFLHCVDFKTGEKKWVYDTFAAVWGSPMVVDGRVLLGDEDGEMVILKAGDKLEEIETKTFNSSIYSTPTIANGLMFVSDRSTLYAIKVK